MDSVHKAATLPLTAGPTARGEIAPRARSTLDAIGGWLRQHGPAIYGCTASDLVPPPDCRYTRRGDRLYLHLFAWPFRRVYLPGLRDQVAFARFLNDGSEVQIAPSEAVSDDDLALALPVQRPEVAIPVVELFLRR